MKSSLDRLIEASACVHIEISKGDVKNLAQVPKEDQQAALQVLLAEKLRLGVALVTMNEEDAREAL